MAAAGAQGWAPTQGLLGEALLGAGHPELCLGPTGPSEYFASPFPIVLSLRCLPTGALTLQLATSIVPSAHPSISRTPQEPRGLVAGWWLKIENPNPLGV